MGNVVVKVLNQKQHEAVLTIGQFVMSKFCENWIGLANSCIYYANQVLPVPVELKDFEIYWVKQHFVNVVLFGIKDL